MIIFGLSEAESTNKTQYLIQKLVPIIKTPQTTPNPSIHIEFKPKFSKNFRNTFLIKNPTKPRLNDLKFCTQIPNDIRKLLQLSEFHSDSRIKISPINRKSPKSQLRQFKPSSTPTSKTNFDHAPKS